MPAAYERNPVTSNRAKPLLLLAATMLASACSSEAVPPEKAKPLQGFRQIEFGASLDEVLTKASPYQFDSYAVQSCIEEMAVEGCLLTQGHGAFFALEDGIPYGVHVAFNVRGQSEGIILVYEKKGGVSEDQCRSIFARTIDWLSLEIEFHPESFYLLDRPENRIDYRTSRGIKYRSYPDSDSAIYDALAKARSAEFSAIGSFIPINDTPQCRISVNIERVGKKKL